MESNKQKFARELEQLINRYSMENGSNTPDFILAEYLIDSLETFNKVTNRRHNWYKPEDKKQKDERKVW